MDRTQRILAILLVVQIGAFVAFEHPFSRGGEAAGRPLLPKLASITPERIEIAGPDSATVVLERHSGSWVLADPAGYPATPGKVEKMLENLEHMTAERPVSSTKSSEAALKVAPHEFERRLRLWTGGTGSPAAELYLGTSPGYGVTHARVGGSDRVVEARGLTTYDVPTETAQWIDRKLVSIPAGDVTEVEVRNGKGAFSIASRGGVWRIQSPPALSRSALDTLKVRDLVRSLCAISIDHPVGPVDAAAQGLVKPEATIRLARSTAGADSALGGPGSIQIRIGGPVAGKSDQRYASRTGLSFAVTVPQYAYDRALTARIKDLLRK